jgi:hypothetical protein
MTGETAAKQAVRLLRSCAIAFRQEQKQTRSYQRWVLKAFAPFL